MKNIIEISSLHFIYPDGTYALKGIDLSIKEREFVALIGQNGSGKTTLSKLIAGLLKPTRGNIIVDGVDATKTPLNLLVTKVGYVFQNPDHQIFNSTVYREIAYGPENLGLPEEEVDKRVRESAKIAGISEEYFEEHPFFLPKGLRQRVAIASILALRPKIIIVDEPTTGQDIKQADEVMGFLRKLNSENNNTIIIITHDMRIVAEYTQRTIVMANGRIILDGETREVFSHPEILKQSYIEPPNITKLSLILKDCGISRTSLNFNEFWEDITKLLKHGGG